MVLISRTDGGGGSGQEGEKRQTNEGVDGEDARGGETTEQVGGEQGRALIFPSVIDLVKYKPKMGGTKAMRNSSKGGAQRGGRKQRRGEGQERRAMRGGGNRHKTLFS